MTFTKISRNRWLPMLALVAAGALGAACNDGADRTPGGMGTSASPTMSPTMSPSASPMSSPVAMVGPITDLNMVYQQPDRALLADRTVQLTNAPVQRVINDQFFWVGTGANQRVLVMSTTPLTGTNRPKQGQTVDLSGTLQRMPASTDMNSQWNLPASARQEVGQEQIYLMAQQVGMAQR